MLCWLNISVVLINSFSKNRDRFAFKLWFIG